MLHADDDQLHHHYTTHWQRQVGKIVAGSCVRTAPLDLLYGVQTKYCGLPSCPRLLRYRLPQVQEVSDANSADIYVPTLRYGVSVLCSLNLPKKRNALANRSK